MKKKKKRTAIRISTPLIWAREGGEGGATFPFFDIQCPLFTCRFSFGREGILLLISLFLTLSASFPRSSGLVWSNLHVSCLLPSPSSPLHHHLHPQQQLSRSRVPLFLPYRRRSRGRCKIFAGYRLFISYLCVPVLLLPLLLLCTERPRVKCLRYGTHYTHTHRTPNACSRV